MIFSFLFNYIFVVNIVYYVVHIVCEVDVIANSLVLYLPFCSTLNKNFFSLLFFREEIRRALGGKEELPEPDDLTTTANVVRDTQR